MAMGVVKKVTDRGYGFIQPDDGSADLFFHIRDTDPRLPFDESLTHARVSFNVIDHNGRSRAADVRPAS